MEDQMIIWERRKFYVRIIFFTLILLALIWVGIQGAGDPCERCKLRIDSLGEKEYTCREIITEEIFDRVDRARGQVDTTSDYQELFVGGQDVS